MYRNLRVGWRVVGVVTTSEVAVGGMALEIAAWGKVGLGAGVGERAAGSGVGFTVAAGLKVVRLLVATGVVWSPQAANNQIENNRATTKPETVRLMNIFYPF